MTTYEKIVKGATKVKVAAPKPKYIEPILMATSIDHPEDTLNTIFRTLSQRLQDSSWSVVYKALIVIHIMIREGDKDVALRHLSQSSMLNLTNANITKGSSFNSDVRFIVKYSKYLQVRVKQFERTGVDYVRDERSNNSTSQTGGRLRTLAIESGLLRECESVQRQIDELLKNNFAENEVNNDVVLTAFRLLVNDLLALFQELNEGVINLLEHYFEVSRVDAERALKIYKKFVDQTRYVIDYLRVAKHLEYATKLHVPTIKHAPTALTSSLEEYLDDPNFEENRQQYLRERMAKKRGTRTLSNPKKEEKEKNRQDQVQQKQEQFQRQDHQDQLQQQSQLQQQQLQLQQLQLQQLQLQPHTSYIFTGQNAELTPSFTGSTPVNTANQVGMNPTFTGNVTTPGMNQVNPGMNLGQVNFTGMNQVTGMNNQFTGINQGMNNQGMNSTITGMNNQGVNSTNFTGMNQVTGMNNQGMNSTGISGMNFDVNQASSGNVSFGQMGTGQFGASLRSSFTGAGFGGYGPQVQNNPFASSLQRSNTNPFAKSNPFSRYSSAPLTASATGNNPFAVSQATKSVFDNYKPVEVKRQVTAGGLENVPTVPVFPREEPSLI